VIALLASVRTVEEALNAAASGADIIDLKEPRGGALGALPLTVIREIVCALRIDRPRIPISATVGEEPLSRVQSVVDCGVDYVKVGVQSPAALQSLASLASPVVPVLLADTGLDIACVELACQLGFPIVMLDTADKSRGSLLDCVPLAALLRIVKRVQASGVRIGLAGALRFEHAAALRELAPDIAGFRGALCDGGRGGKLDPRKLSELCAVLAALPAAALVSGAGQTCQPRRSRSAHCA